MMRKLAMAALVAALGMSMAASAGEVDQRQRNQQRRIGEGVESGQLTPGEAARLENKEGKLHREIKEERAENGGKLTRAERRQVNRQENRLSRQIYRAKHNARHE